MPGEEGHAHLVKGDPPGSVGLGALLGETTRHHDDGSGDFQLTGFEVHVRPPEGAQLAPPHAGQRPA